MYKFNVVTRPILFGLLEHLVVVEGDDIKVKDGRLIIIRYEDDLELLTEFKQWERFEMEEVDG